MPLSKWNRFLEAVPAGQALREVIVESWNRSIEAGLDVHAGKASIPRVPDAELRRRIDDNAMMLDVTVPHLEWLSAGLSGLPHVAYVTDRDGIILHAIGVGTDLEASSLAPGFDWSEKAAGTNGAGTAIAANRPVAIVGADHILAPFHKFTCTGAPVHDPHGEVIGAIDISTNAQDGSPERLLAIAHAAFVIDRELQQRHALTSSNAAVAARDRLLAEVSHEVRTPLTAILGWAQMLRFDSGALPNAIDEIESNAHRLAVLVGDLLEASRLATGKMLLHREPIDLTALTSTVLRTMQPIARKKGVALTMSASGPLQILGDRARLEQVVVNLITNSVKFTPADGTIHVTLGGDGVEARLQVVDTGAGIAADVLPHVFDYLRQGGLRVPSGGLGLGLSIVREIVALHDGHVTAASDGPGSGATLTVTLPLLDITREH